MSKESIFSADALRARRAKPLNLPTYFLRLPSALTIALILASTFAGLAWSVFAKIPVKVPGKAVVVNVNDIKPLITKSSGRILILPPSISATRTLFDKQLFKFYNQTEFDGDVPDLLTTIKQVLLDTSPEQFANYSKLTNNSSLLNDISTSRFKVIRGQVVTIVFNEESRTKLSNKMISSIKKFNTNNLEIKRGKTNLNSLKAQAARQSQMVKAYQELKRVGASSQVNLLDSIQTLNNLNQQISEAKNKIDQIKVSNKSLSSELQSELIEYITSMYVFSDANGYVSNISKGNEQYSDTNQPILFFSSQPTYSLPPWIVGFTDDRSANQIRDGMTVIATPEGVNKSQYGGIRGHVSTKVPYTMTSKKLSNIVGIESLADISRTAATSPNLLVIRLSMAPDGNSYKWTTSQTPPVKTGIGDVLNLDINVQEQSPLMMAIPFIKKYLGLEGPTDFTESR